IAGHVLVGALLLLARQLDEQRVHLARLTVDPAPHEQRTHEDVAGNRVTWFHVTAAHSRLEVVTKTFVSVDRPFVDSSTLPQLPWDQVVGLVRGIRSTGRPGDGTHPGPSQVIDVTAGALPSDLVPLSDDAQALALDTFAPGQPLARAVATLSGRIHREFEYRQPMSAGLDEVLRARSGAYHDLAHVMLAALRALGLSALYVTGYREPRESAEPRDAAHAWVAVWFPGAGWVHVDPTNGTFIDDRYVVLGWGRDSRDVPPLRGIAFTEGGGSTMSTRAELRSITVDELGARLRALGV
ncbi:MAG: transglutaminase family protein, partial [Actinomycetota bacterium]